MNASSLSGPAGELLISTFLDRVALKVEGGEIGAEGPNRGAMGVETSRSYFGVELPLVLSDFFPARGRGVEIIDDSSISVSASSSSTACDLRFLDLS